MILAWQDASGKTSLKVGEPGGEPEWESGLGSALQVKCICKITAKSDILVVEKA